MKSKGTLTARTGSRLLLGFLIGPGLLFEQRLFQKLWTLLFFPTLALPGFDFRFHWSTVPVWLAVTAQDQHFR